MRRALQDADPAGWCLQADTLGGLSDRVEHLLRARGEAARVEFVRGGDVTVSKGGRSAEFFRCPAEAGIWEDWEWATRAPERRAEDALRWVLGWPGRG